MSDNGHGKGTMFERGLVERLRAAGLPLSLKIKSKPSTCSRYPRLSSTMPSPSPQNSQRSSTTKDPQGLQVTLVVPFSPWENHRFRNYRFERRIVGSLRNYHEYGKPLTVGRGPWAQPFGKSTIWNTATFRLRPREMGMGKKEHGFLALASAKNIEFTRLEDHNSPKNAFHFGGANCERDRARTNIISDPPNSPSSQFFFPCSFLSTFGSILLTLIALW